MNQPRAAIAAAGVAALLLLLVPMRGGDAPLLLNLPLRGSPAGLAETAAPIIPVIAGLLALRRWPWLLAAAALITLATTVSSPAGAPEWLLLLQPAARPLTVIALFAAAQSLIGRGHTRLGAVLAGSSVAVAVIASASSEPWWFRTQGGMSYWYVAFAAVALAALAPAVWLLRSGDEAARPGGILSRPTIAGGLAVALAIPLSLITTERLAELVGVDEYELYRHAYAADAIIAAVTLAVVAVLAAIAGPWPLGGALTAALAQLAAAGPLLMAMSALQASPAPWLAVVGGLALGAALAAARRRVPLAAAVTVAAAVALLIAYSATIGHPEKLAGQQRVIPAILIAVLVTAAVVAVVGATATAVAPSGTAPATLGPLAGVLALSGMHVVDSGYFTGSGLALKSLPSREYLGVSIWLLFVAAAAAGGLGLARHWSDRRTERRLAEQIRREAAEAERNRLARPIHDGVLQVLALVQRHGADLGGTGAELASLAGEQEVALRTLLSGGAAVPPPRGRAEPGDLRTTLTALASPTVEVAAPAGPVPLPQPAAAEVTAAVEAALDNVRRHAGPDARAWVLLEDEGDGVRITVRDNGAGFDPARLGEAAGEGRLGVAQSIRGRIEDLGGTTDVFSRPGQGTEIELWVPR
ncbi:ATP-binding protein [Dactylosporangium sp. NPDC051485]|uniref:MacS family sensor histidine kinase n=1 Tax=Dactylosporangium sp. NPDC051485 TaxID=3154846 RepID=UPI00342F4246